MDSKFLKMDFYKDGLNVYEMNCLDIPIAGASGVFGKENYYLYLFQLCVNANWRRVDGHVDNMYKCLSNIGLKIEPVQINGARNLIRKIKEQIDSGYPVLLPVLYAEMFFCSRYKQYYASHFLLLDGYVEDYHTILLREELSAISSMQLKEIRGLYSMRLKYDMIEQMWARSQEFIEPIFSDRIFIIRPYTNPKFQDRKHMLSYILQNYNFTQGLFVDDVLIKGIHMKDVRKQVEQYRNLYYKYTYCFFYLLDQYIQKRVTQELYLQFKTFSQSYLNSRDIMITKVHMACLKGEKMSTTEMIHDAKKLDEQLKHILSQVVQQLQDCKCESGQVVEENLVFQCVISASSCEDEQSKNASNVRRDDESIWKSKKSDLPHWISFELPEEKRLNKLCIMHHPEQHKMTKDFQIQGSQDGVYWQTLEIVENNFHSVTEHDLKGERYRFLRIYITIPALLKRTAIIRCVKMW